ncbi:putative RNA polymerase II subunit B1 CTD phosphatase RPAP2 homolog [Dioscorea cayenensis subsp. rotundata]|uniref:RNA polymerase II subunit B1 CTD phosphatase RPAP2 homolog n=1 Tax=Dioscorea cayennensis subsp. rotundata TaxID=55577 RepID=A0AB40BM43_DIOCR|nr:putative RNA polymerase II subunit B1 CTD phosphatase RPAP2 homolog [Dioscorea cayenensis subsp. rotundata]
MAVPSHSATIADAVHRIQLALLDGAATSEGQLLAAGTLLSQPDYDDVVVERSLARLCGHPLCTKALSSTADSQRRRGRYRIALREHKVYDLEETYKYCSQACLVSSRAFAESLERERVGDVSLKVDGVLRVFGLGKDEDLPAEKGLGIGDLKIKEKEQAGNGDVSMEEWLGPSDAIEGYVPLRDRKQGAKYMSEDESTKMVDDAGNGEMGFTSCLIMENELSVPQSDKSSVHQQDISNMIAKQLENLAIEEKNSPRERTSGKTRNRKAMKKVNACKAEEEIKRAAIVCEQSKATPPNKHSVVLEDLSEQLGKELEERLHLEKETVSNGAVLKSSLKSGGSKDGKTVTWADETYKAPEKKDADHGGSSNAQVSHDDADEDLRLASAEACAAALIRAAETVASGTSDATDAASEAGIIILPQLQNNEKGGIEEDEEMFELDRGRVKWPTKPVLLDTDMFEVEDSWHDTPPEGFKLTLSSFATMWMALFGWITSSSIAYIYGFNESSHEDFLTVNGREYPRKIILQDGKSSEIRQTLDICVGRAIPALVMDLRLSLPVSSLEKAVGQLLDTMSLIEAVPAFRTKQWHVIVLLFLEALSLHRLPALAQHMASRNTLLHKVLNPAKITSEEYKTMVDLIIPLGRVPQTNSQTQ